jgi:hypothetical protein
VIGRFWVIHHRFFGEVIGFDIGETARSGIRVRSVAET